MCINSVLSWGQCQAYIFPKPSILEFPEIISCFILRMKEQSLIKNFGRSGGGTVSLGSLQSRLGIAIRPI